MFLDICVIIVFWLKGDYVLIVSIVKVKKKNISDLNIYKLKNKMSMMIIMIGKN